VPALRRAHAAALERAGFRAVPDALVLSGEGERA
jgi:hypothetical protein